MTKSEILAAQAKKKGPLAALKDDEPVFILRARDPLAMDLIALWADRAHALGVNDAKVDEAVGLHEEFRAWAANNGGHRTPD